MSRILRIAGWAVIVGGVLYSAINVVLNLAQQAFDKVAGAGFPAVAGLLGGAVLVAIAHYMDHPARLELSGPRDPVARMLLAGGGLLTLIGGGYFAYAVVALESWSFAVYAGAPGLLAAIVGGVLLLVGFLRALVR